MATMTPATSPPSRTETALATTTPAMMASSTSVPPEFVPQVPLPASAAMRDILADLVLVDNGVPSARDLHILSGWTGSA